MDADLNRTERRGAGRCLAECEGLSAFPVPLLMAGAGFHGTPWGVKVEKTTDDSVHRSDRRILPC